MELSISGEIIRNVREAKNYTQKFLSDHIVRQSTYSKIERGEIEPSASKLFSLLDRLEMTFEEFLFIQNGYGYTPKGKIIEEFKYLTHTDTRAIQAVKEEAEYFSKEHDDVLIKDIAHICEGLLILCDSGDLKEAQEAVTRVWERLEKFDEWFLTELHLINHILYLFPIETAVHITNRAINELKKYKEFKSSKQLIFDYQMNLSYLLLHQKEFEKFLALIDEVIEKAKASQNHTFVALCTVRKGIALKASHDESGQKWIDKGMHILEVIEEEKMRKHAQKEVDQLMTIQS